MQSGPLPLKQRLGQVVDLRVPHFLRSVPPGVVGQRAFSDLSTLEWYESFVKRVTGAIGRNYLPVFRLSDGEFYFSTGFRPPRPPQKAHKIRHYARAYLGALRVGRLPGRFRSGSPNYGWEEFAWVEWYNLRREFITYLRQIAGAGILAMNFTVTEPPFSEQYFEPFCDWLDRNDICVTTHNYYPFYFVYALLNGPDRAKVFQGRRVLVVTSYDEAKKNALTEALQAVGVEKVIFYPVSRSKALKDNIDPTQVEGPVDVAVIAAGVGASKAIVQFAPLNTLCLDAGYCLEILADPGKRQSRVFCVPDDLPAVFDLAD